eukprot:742216-Ditylum_brightwellii.AAC.1
MTEYHPGGSATLITDKWASNVCNSGKYVLGRWSFDTIKGLSTCWKQQWRQLRKWDYKEPDPRRLFLKDFE